LCRAVPYKDCVAAPAQAIDRDGDCAPIISNEHKYGRYRSNVLLLVVLVAVLLRESRGDVVWVVVSFVPRVPHNTEHVSGDTGYDSIDSSMQWEK